MSEERPYQPIEAYALLSNCRGSALVARDGSIDWACLERFDAAPSFSRLLDRGRGGWFAICPDEPFEVTRQYLGSTNILETTFTTASGTVALLDFMADEPIAAADAPRLVRLVTGIAGTVPMVATYRPLAGFDESFAPLAVADRRVTADQHPVLVADADFAIEGEVATARFALDAGADQRFCVHLGDAPDEPCDVRALMLAVQSAWVDWTQDAAYDGPLADELTRSALVLKALTYHPTGAIVAAATTSLPEEIGGVRNWDYRYCWIRDASLSFYTLKKFGMVAEAEAFFGFVAKLCDGTEGLLKPLYSIAGDDNLAEAEIGHFEGWRGSAPVRHGNEAAEQHQSDAYGQLLDLFYFYDRLGGTLSDDLRAHGARLADVAAAQWREPDAGLWEPRKPEQRYLHSAIMNWVALDRAIALFGEREDWCREREAIRACVNGEGIHSDGYYPQHIGSAAVDAALLIAPMVGFPVDEAAFERTVDKVIADLGHDHLLYRYRTDDGLPGHEGTFLICAFWLVDALLWLGRDEEARMRFEALRALKNDVGLYAEEAAEDGTFLGNFPQAFSHLAFIHSALMIDLYDAGGRAAVAGSYADRALRETPSRRTAEVAARR